MSSPFIGLHVKLSLHSQPNHPLKAKIVSINASNNTLIIQKQDGSQHALSRSDIASISAQAQSDHQHAPASSSSSSSSSSLSLNGSPRPKHANVPSRSNAATPGLVFNHNPIAHNLHVRNSPKPFPAQALPFSSTSSSSSPAPFADPAILSFSKTDTVPSSLVASSAHQSAAAPPLAESQPSSPSPVKADRAHDILSKKTNKKKPSPSNHPAPSPSLSSKNANTSAIPAESFDDDFDFNAGLKAFNKKKIWDEIRSHDDTDPASLLVSHNRISGPTQLMRGPNGVGPANSFSTPDRRRASRNGQKKLRPNEMVLSPSPPSSTKPLYESEDENQSEVDLYPNRNDTTRAVILDSTLSKASLVMSTQDSTGKPTYEQLEAKIRRLEAELAIANRKNVLLEELVGLGLGLGAAKGQDGNAVNVDTNVNVQDIADGDVVGKSNSNLFIDPAILSTSRGMSSLNINNNPTRHPSDADRQQTLERLESKSALTSATTSSNTPSASLTAAAPVAEKEKIDEPQFGHLVESPIITLLFPTTAIQHSALARMEAFYESHGTSQQYLSLEQANEQRICRNYQGFNLPIQEGVKDWLRVMWNATHSSTTELLFNNVADDATHRWWATQCNAVELQLIDLLVTHQAISNSEGWNGQSSPTVSQDGNMIRYLISSTASQCQSTLPHERLHALYFLSPEYRTIVANEYATLSSNICKTIEYDLGTMRHYSPKVWHDEFQAYLADGAGTEREFGNKCADECGPIAIRLRDAAEKQWLKYQPNGFDPAQREAKWDALKWQVLDRYAASSSKKNTTGSPTKGKKKEKADKRSKR